LTSNQLSVYAGGAAHNWTIEGLSVGWHTFEKCITPTTTDIFIQFGSSPSTPRDFLIEYVAITYLDGNDKGTTYSTGTPSTTEYPKDGNYGMHVNTSSGTVYRAYNLNGVIKSIALS
jgi:hypothetical protein